MPFVPVTQRRFVEGAARRGAEILSQLGIDNSGLRALEKEGIIGLGAGGAG
jgi:hypothetical protein